MTGTTTRAKSCLVAMSKMETSAPVVKVIVMDGSQWTRGLYKLRLDHVPASRTLHEDLKPR